MSTKKKYILALDQGTTSSRAILFDKKGNIVRIAQQEFAQHFPKSGWVEHNAEEIWQSQLIVTEEVIRQQGIAVDEIGAIGITNQRETTVVWDKKSGKPIYNAIVWQDKRTSKICEGLKANGLTDHVRKTTGLVIDPYFSGTKIKWILDNIKDARSMAEHGQLLFGTIDTWLIWKITQGKQHVTDYSNASRTMIFDIHELKWDEKMLKALEIPMQMLPKVLNSSDDFGMAQLMGERIPIRGVAGDQQAALFGQTCFDPGTAKNTYGTGCFMLMNTGDKSVESNAGLLTTIAWGLNGKITYALEGSVFIAGAAIQWLRDGLKIIDEAPDSEYFASKLEDAGDVYVVPAFAGLGAPYWDMYARGGIFGLTRDTGKAHLVKATLDSLAYQSKDVLTAMEKDSNIKLERLQVDGGAAANNQLMQFQANILDVPIVRPSVIESTAQGAAYLAGLAIGFWTMKDLSKPKSGHTVFNSVMSEDKRYELYKGWLKAVERCKGWLDN